MWEIRGSVDGYNKNIINVCVELLKNKNIFICIGIYIYMYKINKNSY